ncbi:MAG: sugar ABC transporter ATP-binding protein, partial [Chloroflexota bacterium]|nr:sugar ABC transporter ATP-binding protein [Chloroflexota bacterium]
LYEICDRVTVMRDGRTVGDYPMAEISRLELVAKMLGKDLGEVQRQGQTAFSAGKAATDQVLLGAAHLKRGRALRDASVSVNVGEIVGLAGLLGSGRTEVARAIFAADRIEDGDIQFEGRPAHFHAPADAIRAGIGFISEDRKSEGIIPHLSVEENLTLAALPLLSRHGIVSKEKQRALVDQFTRRLGIRMSGPDQKISELSGGNQQKVLLARWLCLNPRLLILDEPTRGIDIGAKAEIQALINEFADNGLGVLMISSEIEELAEGSDRIVVLRDGRTVAELQREQINQDTIMSAMANGSDGAPDVTEAGV